MISTAPSPITVPEVRPSDPTSGPLDYISASRLRCYQTCRRQFYYRYIERIPTIVSPALHVGKTVHHVLQKWNLRRWRGEPCDADDLRGCFQDYWIQKQPNEGIDWGNKEEAEKDKAWAMLEHYLAHTPIPKEERPDAVEVVVERDLMASGLPPIKGVIDLVRSNGIIVDFKTTARTPDPSTAPHLNSLQMGIYALLYREATSKTEKGIELHFLVKTKTPKLVVLPLDPLTPERTRGLMRQIESYVSGVSDEDFVPSPGQHCSWCDYLDRCKAHP